MRIANATNPIRRRIGVTPVRRAELRPPRATASATAARGARGRAGAVGAVRFAGRVVFEEVEVEIVVVVRAHRCSRRGTGVSLRHASARKDGPLPRRRGDDRVEHRVRPSRPRPRPRPLPASPTARPRRLRLRLARPRRADRARGRAQDRPARRQARLTRRAGDGGRIAAPPRALRPRLRLRRRQRPRLHRLRVRPRPHAARDAARRQARRPRRRRGRRRRSSTHSRTRTASGSSTAT